MVIFFPKFEKGPDLTTKNAGIILLASFSVLFLILSLTTTALTVKFPQFAGITVELWKMFGTTYGALFIAINVAGHSTPPPPPPAVPGP